MHIPHNHITLLKQYPSTGQKKKTKKEKDEALTKAEIEAKKTQVDTVGTVKALEKAFEQLTSKEGRVANRINLVHGEKVIFGAEDEFAVTIENGEAKIVKRTDIDDSKIYVHDITRENPSVAFSLSRLSHGPYGPTPMGVFRKVQRETYNEDVMKQIDFAKDSKGDGELDKLVRSLGTWDVK